MKATMLLADAAQAVDGKLYVLGGGWSITGPAPAPFAIAVKVEVPWDQAARRHALRLELLDADGDPVLLPTVDGGSEAVVIEQAFETGIPPGLKPGTPLDFAFAINFGPLPLAPDGRYEWRMSIDGVAHDEWRLAFSTRRAGDEGLPFGGV